MNHKSLQKILAFTMSLEALKKLERFRGNFYWKDYPARKRYESVADHSWRLAVLLIVIADELSKKIDLEKALKMVLIHDIPEIIAGDASPLGEDGTGKGSHAFDRQEAEDQHKVEKRAAEILFKKLPKDQAEELLALWIEFEEQESFEAQVIKSLDKLECILQILEYRKGHIFKKHLEFNLSYGLRGSEVDPALEQLGQLLVEEYHKRYREFKKS